MASRFFRKSSRAAATSEVVDDVPSPRSSPEARGRRAQITSSAAFTIRRSWFPGRISFAETVSIAPGTRLGPYEIVAPLGANGSGAPRPGAGWTKGATPLQWSADGRSLYVTTETDIPMSIRKLDLQTGRSELVKKLVPPDMAGVQTIAAPLVTRDGRTYAYTYMRLLGDLYVADGLK